MDQRADLYALGALLYELATGAPPFGAGDPLELSRDHLARVPVPPVQVNPAAHATNAMVSVAMTEEGSGTVLRVRVRDDGCGETDLTRGTGPIGLVDGRRHSAVDSSCRVPLARAPLCTLNSPRPTRTRLLADRADIPFP